MDLNDGYTLLTKNFISSGRHSRVFVGISPTKTKTAVKLYKDVKVYNREISILKELHNNANVPTVLSTGNIRKVLYYIVMPYYTTSLNDVIKNNGILSVEEGLYLFYDLVLCLEEIHSLDIIHRDIKPMNIMLHNKSMVIIDFSLATHKDHKMSTNVIGSPIFMSINAHRKELKKYTYKDDLMSCYYTFLYCIEGSLPWSNIPNLMPKSRLFEEIHFQKSIFKSDYDYLCKNDHADIVLEIENFFKKESISMSSVQEKFYEKIDTKNSHSIF
jgi:serine/threonine protein kinase